jgi:hypothetical protein
MGSNFSRGMDVFLRLFCNCVLLYRQRPCDGLITHPTDCLYEIQISELINSEWAHARQPNPTSKEEEEEEEEEEMMMMNLSRGTKRIGSGNEDSGLCSGGFLFQSRPRH